MTSVRTPTRPEALALMAVRPDSPLDEISTHEFRESISDLRSMVLVPGNNIGAQQVPGMGVYDLVIKPVVPDSKQEPVVIAPRQVLLAKTRLDKKDPSLRFVKAPNPNDDKPRLQDAAARLVHLNLVRMAIGLVAEAGTLRAPRPILFTLASLDLISLARPATTRPFYDQELLLGRDSQTDVLQIFKRSLGVCGEASIPLPESTGQTITVGEYLKDGRTEEALRSLIHLPNNPVEPPAKPARQKKSAPKTRRRVHTSETPEDEAASKLSREFLKSFAESEASPRDVLSRLATQGPEQRAKSVRAAVNKHTGPEEQSAYALKGIRFYVDSVAKQTDHSLFKEIRDILDRKEATPLDVVKLSNALLANMSAQREEPHVPHELSSENVPLAFNDLLYLVGRLGADRDMLFVLGKVVQGVVNEVFAES